MELRLLIARDLLLGGGERTLCGWKGRGGGPDHDESGAINNLSITKKKKKKAELKTKFIFFGEGVNGYL